jgi:tetratricopeptide (TPR) repeat protein
MPEIFLSYRRQDTDHALSLYMWLIKRYGREAVFWDRKNIDAGRDFAEILTRGIKKSVVFIALIGAEWLAVDNAGRHRIDSPEDWVRRETSSALERRMLVIPVLGSGARMPAAQDLPVELKRFSRLQALSITDMRFPSLLAESLAKAGIHEKQSAGPGKKRVSALALRAGNLLRRQAERLQIRAKELIRDGKTERALEELNEGTELMMALLDVLPGEQDLDLQLGYIYGALADEFDAMGNNKMMQRYLDLQLGIFERVKEDLSAAEYLTGEAATTIKGIGEVYFRRGDFDRAIEYYRKSLEIEPGYQYAWHDLFGAYDAMAERGRIDLDAMRSALQKTRETSAGPQPGTQVPGLDLEYLQSLEARLRHWEKKAAEHPDLLISAAVPVEGRKAGGRSPSGAHGEDGTDRLPGLLEAPPCPE